MLQIHKLIKQARLSAGLSEEEMAEKIGVGRTTYQYWEKKTPSLDNLQKVINALELPNDYFFVNRDEEVSTIRTKGGNKLKAGNIEITLQEYLDSIKEQKRLAEENAKSSAQHARDLKEIMHKQLEKIETNLSLVLGGVHQQSLYMESLRTISLNSLARIEKKKENSLLAEADKMLFDKIESLKKQDTTAVGDK